MITLVAVPPDKAQEAWPLAEKYAQSAAGADQTGFSQVADIHMNIMLGEAILWLAADGTKVIGAGATRIIEDGRRYCEIFFWAADDQKKCAPLLKTIEKYAKDERCVSVRLAGRRGWARLLPDYKLVSVILDKAI